VWMVSWIDCKGTDQLSCVIIQGFMLFVYKRLLLPQYINHPCHFLHPRISFKAHKTIKNIPIPAHPILNTSSIVPTTPPHDPPLFRSTIFILPKPTSPHPLSTLLSSIQHHLTAAVRFPSQCYSTSWRHKP